MRPKRGAILGHICDTHHESRPATTIHTPPRPPIPSYDAAKESNLPSGGLPRPASFEDRMSHQAPAAPRLMLRGTGEHRVRQDQVRRARARARP